jgi:hypothetical protein
VCVGCILGGRGRAHVAAKLTMLELATSVVDRWRSCLIVRESSGGKAYLVDVSIDNLFLGLYQDATYQDQKATKKPNHAKKKTRP